MKKQTKLPMDPFEKYYTKAIKFLSYRPRSEKEVRDRLKKKPRHSRLDREFIYPRFREDDSLKIIDQVIKKLKEQEFINDEEFAKWWIEQRNQFKPRSIRIIKMELKQKGIASELIQAHIQSSESRIQNDLKQAKKLVQKRIQRYKGLPKQEVYQKLGLFLARKGFGWDTIKESVDEILKEGV
ncbi:MAG: hypothetical protein A3F31_02565 [Candidatus Levybacteria bacterium RIFCSPHIGHO2_12_FULL_38_12]|nr:MAG: hypothetical protein A3F31_02565 [Candidatus Levybacteria bacterium RIFCSPHIGHO2_12_FULL_38_12]OGH44314.1 MAG: hypothetical protein A3J14_03870 [Candidatus Levybacteria bacterium RIFCSPLOWO2_02_FULL_37_18]